MVTVQDSEEQQHNLDELAADLAASHRATLSVASDAKLLYGYPFFSSLRCQVSFDPTLHDRQCIFDNGWTVKIGRGLDYFRAPTGRYCVGFHDLDLRPCLATTVDIYRAVS